MNFIVRPRFVLESKHCDQASLQKSTCSDTVAGVRRDDLAL